MEFEFDPAKSASNKDKHGIDFVEARLCGETSIPLHFLRVRKMNSA
tara:strand:- start:659 stop:796 length:138 start_codon:yes stop_codon:yes gene_type:complete